ncbi:MAG: response regulator transcription factor [Patescibacteria group bacterium UBA2103]
MDAKKKILIAEDEKPLAEALSTKLSNAGYEVDVAGDGSVACERMNNGAYDMAIVDLVMPEKDGFAVLEEMKEKGITTPIIVVSNLAQEVDKERALALGAEAYFVKSNTPLSQLVEEVKKRVS